MKCIFSLIIGVFLWALCPISLNGQTTGELKKMEIDSLENVWKNMPQNEADTVKMSVLNCLSKIYNSQSNYAQILQYGNNAISIYNKAIGNASGKTKSTLRKQVGFSYNLSGFAYLQLGKIDSGMVLLEKCIVLSKEDNDLSRLSSVYITMGDVMLRQSKWEEAKSYYMQTLHMAQKNKDEGNLLRAFNSLGRVNLITGNHTAALDYNKKSLKIIEQSEDAAIRERVANVYVDIGATYMSMEQSDTALYYYNKALELHIEMEKKSSVALTTINIGLIYYRQNKTALALEKFIEGAKLAEDAGSLEQMGKAYSLIGAMFEYQEKYNKSLEYYKKALDIFQKMEHQTETLRMYAEIGSHYVKLNQLDSATKYLTESLNLAIANNDKRIAGVSYDDLGAIFSKKKDFTNSLKNYHSALKVWEEMELPTMRGRTSISIGNLWLQNNVSDSAKVWILKGIELLKPYNDYYSLFKAYNKMYEIYNTEGNHEKALAFHSLMSDVKDSLTTLADQESLNKLLVEYQSNEKEKENTELKLLNTEKELALVRRNRMLIGGGIGAFALLSFLGFSYRSSRQKRVIAEKEKSIQEEKVKSLERERQVISLQAMVNGQESERSRVAKDLHDSMGAMFSTLKMYLSTIESKETHLQQNELYIKSKKLVDSSAEEMRRIAHDMMPEVLLRLGLVQAVQELTDNINAAKSLHITFQHFDMEARMPASFERMLYRIVQELLNNIIKHSGATETVVEFIKSENSLNITIEDNGKGFNATNDKEGLNTVKQRVQYLDGKMQIDSENNIGTTIMMEFAI